MRNEKFKREVRILLYVMLVPGIIGGAFLFVGVIFGWESVLLVLMRIGRALGL